MASLPFLEARLDVRVTAGASSTVYIPGRTKIYTAGKLSQNFTASVQKLRFDVTHGIRNPELFAAVQDAFYVVMLTPYEGLRYKHWPDYVATLNNSRATLLPASSTVLQLQRLHRFGGVEYLRDIFKPVTGTVDLYRRRAGVRSAIGGAVDYTTGRATIAGHASGDVYSWTGEFDIPVAFTDDEWSADLIGSKGNPFMVSGSVKLEEIGL